MNPGQLDATLNRYHQLQLKCNTKYDRLRDLPSYLVHDVSRHFNHAFDAFNELWTFQQLHRRTLATHGGLARSDIGEIAARIGHLHYLWYLRCADTRFLLESYIFYEAIHARQYYQEQLLGGVSLAVDQPSAREGLVAEQQLRYYARFILVCIMLGKKEEAMNLMQEFQALVAAHTMNKDAGTTHEWPLVLAEVGALLTADPGMPLPRSPGAALSFRPCCRVWPSGAEAACSPHSPVIHHAVLIGYHHRQTKLAELPVDMLRIMQALEWQDERLMASEAGISDSAASAYPPTTASTTPIPATTNGRGSGPHNRTPSDVPSHQSTPHDETLTAEERARAGMVGTSPGPASLGPGGGGHPNTARVLHARLSASAAAGGAGTRNPPKTLLYRTTTPAALAALQGAAATIPREGPSLLLLYLGCSSVRGRLAARATGLAPSMAGREGGMQQVARLPPVASTSCLTSSLASLANGPSLLDISGADLGGAWCLSPPPAAGSGSSGSEALPPCQCALRAEDLRALTRHRLMVIADGDVACQLRSLSGTELGHPLIALMSPRHRPSAFGDPTRTGQLFTLFLTLPVSAMCLIMGEHDPSPHTLRSLQDAVDESLACIASALAQALAPVQAPSGSTGALGGLRARSDSRASLDSAQAIWALPFKDVLLRQFMCRFVLARAALAYHRASTGRPECQPDCVPDLPLQVSPSGGVCVEAVHRIAAVIRRQALFEGHGEVPVLAGAADSVPGAPGSASLAAGMLQHAAQAVSTPPMAVPSREHSGASGATSSLAALTLTAV